MPKMKHVIGLLYVITALIGFCWSIYLTLTGLYGVPFSRWYVVILIGAALLLIGAILWWTSNREWTRWFPIIGSSCLAAYFIPLLILMIREHSLEIVRVICVILVLASLVIAVKERHVTRYPQLQQQ